MKLRLIPLFIIILIIQGCSESSLSPNQLANKIVKTYEAHTSLSYDINYQIKYFNQIEDTTKVFAQIDLIKAPEDTIFGGHVWISSDSIDRYYDTNFLYLIQHKKKTITRYPKNKSFAITGNTVGEAIRMYFFAPQRLITGLSDSTNIIELKTAEVNDKELWHWKYLFPDDEYTENVWKNIWIDKENFSIPKMTYSADMQGENQYNQWDLKNITYDNITVDDLQKRFTNIKANYELSDYKPRSKEESSPLANGIDIPNVEGALYSDSTLVNLDEYRGHLLLIDFWYMDCFPCINAIPHLNDLHNKYKTKGLTVLGINPYNNNEKDIKRFPNFLVNNKIDYPIVFVNRKDVEQFKVFGYPTFYMVDQQGKIIYSQVGFGEEMSHEIDSLIQANI